MRHLILAACLCSAAVPAAAQQARSISATDRAQGAQANPQLVAEYGGAYTGPQAAFVERVGKRVAVESGLSNAGGDFTVQTLNSPVENAFAIPGGYVYVTRQLLALMNSEAELASVLGHEVGHVAANHSRGRQRASGIGSILGSLGQAAAGQFRGLASPARSAPAPRSWRRSSPSSATVATRSTRLTRSASATSPPLATTPTPRRAC